MDCPPRAPPLRPAQLRRSGSPPACPSPFHPPSPARLALLFPSEVAAGFPLQFRFTSPPDFPFASGPKTGLSASPESSGWPYNLWPVASCAFFFLWASVRACPAMNEEYDVIVLGTGLTVSAEFPAAAAREPGRSCRPAAGEGRLGSGPHAPSSGMREP